jgi:hypothetical protein
MLMRLIHDRPCLSRCLCLKEKDKGEADAESAELHRHKVLEHVWVGGARRDRN